MMFPGLVWRDGYDFTAVQVVFDSCGIDQNRRPEILKQVTQIIDILDKERRKRAAR